MKKVIKTLYAILTVCIFSSNFFIFNVSTEAECEHLYLSYTGINSVNCLNQITRQYKCDNCDECFDAFDEDCIISCPAGSLYIENGAIDEESENNYREEYEKGTEININDLPDYPRIQFDEANSIYSDFVKTFIVYDINDKIILNEESEDYYREEYEKRIGTEINSDKNFPTIRYEDGNDLYYEITENFINDLNEKFARNESTNNN